MPTTRARKVWRNFTSLFANSLERDGGRRPACRLGVEHLEDRTVFSVNFPLTDTAWTAVGPQPITNGQTAGGGNVAGRVAGLAAHPTVAGTYYAAFAGGGVWKTTNSGTNWTPLTDNLSLPDSQKTLFMGAIALAPSNPNIVYAGTGEATNSALSFYGRGILKSTDAGATWTMVGNTQFNRRTISAIAVHPTDPNTFYVSVLGGGVNGQGGGAGVYKTTDGGTNFTLLAGGLPASGASDVKLDPTNPNVVYAGLGVNASSSNGVYKSTDAGATWSLLAGGLPASTSTWTIKLGIAPSLTSTVYASITSSTFPYPTTVYRSTDSGATWTAGGSTGQSTGWYQNTIAVDPTNASVLYMAGLEVRKSENGATTWIDIDTGSNFNGPHVDNHAMTFTSDGKLLNGNDGGVWRLDNPTVGSINWANLNATLNTIQFMGIALHPTNAAVMFGGTQDNGTNQFSDALGWTLREGGDGGDIEYSNQNTSRMYHQAPQESFGTSGFFRRSDNGGLNWSAKTSGISGIADNFYAPFAVDPTNGDRVVYGSYPLQLSTNAADNWAAIGTNGVGGWASTSNPRAVAITGNTVYAALGDGNLYVTTDAGATWAQRNGGSVVTAVSQVTIDPTNSLIAYATREVFTSGKVYRTTDGGATWANITNNLPDVPTYTLAIDPRGAGTADDVLYVGNDIGVFVSTNLGASWTRLGGTSLPDVQVRDLELNTTTRTLAAGTHGRGAWQILSLALAPTNVTSTSLDGTYGVGAIIPITVQFSGPVTVTGTPTLALNPTGSPTAAYASGSGTNTLTFNYTVAAGQNAADLDYASTAALTGGTLKDANGNFVNRTLPAPGAAGSLGANKNIAINASGTPMITGKVFEDWNGNGVANANDPVVAGQVVFLDADSSGTLNGAEQSATTAGDGTFAFFAVPNGTYSLRTTPVGWTLSAPAGGGHPITVTAPSNQFTGRDFGQGKNNRVYGYAWNDADGDGVVDGGESAAAGRTVYLDLNNSDTFDTGPAVFTFPNTTDVPIPNGTAQVTSQTTVSGLTSAIADVNVRVNIQHDWMNDLDVFLIGPDGTRVTLFRDVGPSSAGFFTNTVLDDEAAIAITSGTPPYTGSFRPEGLLSAFDGKTGAAANGPWTLEVNDDFPGADPGTLLDWDIVITAGVTEPSAVTAANGNASFDLIAGPLTVRMVTTGGETLSVPAGSEYSVNPTGAPLYDRRFGLAPAVPPPAVTGVLVNGTTAPASNYTASRLTSLTVTFNTAVSANPADLGAGAFTLTRTVGGAATLTNGSGISVSGYGTNVLTLTFTGAAGVVDFGSLGDGIWTLTTNHALVRNTAGAAGTAPPTATANIRRLFGDGDGNGLVNLVDFGLFGNTFGKGTAAVGFNPAFNWNGDGAIDLVDFGAFGQRFGKGL